MALLIRMMAQGTKLGADSAGSVVETGVCSRRALPHRGRAISIGRPGLVIPRRWFNLRTTC